MVPAMATIYFADDERDLLTEAARSTGLESLRPYVLQLYRLYGEQHRQRMQPTSSTSKGEHDGRDQADQRGT